MARRRLLSSVLLARGVVAGVLAVGLVVTSVSVSAVAAPATGPGQVLILGSTVTGGAGSIEAQEVTARGLTPVVVDDATWSGLSTADFASYRALLGSRARRNTLLLMVRFCDGSSGSETSAGC